MSEAIKVKEHPTDRYYIGTRIEQFEVSESTWREVAAKGHESFDASEHPGYFWTSHVLEVKS